MAMFDRKKAWELNPSDFRPQWSTSSRLAPKRTIRRFSVYRKSFKSTGRYQGNPIYYETVKVGESSKRSFFKELAELKNVSNINICTFMGAFASGDKYTLVFEYCPKGSLRDLIDDEQFQFDWVLKKSFIHDIMMGLKYLHNSPICYHGLLRSANCLIDSRYIVKLMNFSPKTTKRIKFNSIAGIDTGESYLTMAPELFDRETLEVKGGRADPQEMRKCDIYSFSIICQEVICHTTPFHHREAGLSPYLTKYWDPNCPAVFKQLLVLMWNAKQFIRPPINFVCEEFTTMIGKCEVGSVVDTLMNRLCTYACQLEEMVEERTHDLKVEKARSDELLSRSEDLLYQMLPPQVARDLRCGKAIQAQSFDCVTIYFSDIVGFTSICSRLEPLQIVELLNNLYSLMDTIIADYNVYKVETIGDAYMLASGLSHNDDHAKEIALTSLHLVKSVSSVTVPTDDTPLSIRIGINSGPICAGVVGIKMPRFCLFGDTVNVASRMESTGRPQRIHLSRQTKLLLDPLNQFRIVSRGVVDIKGKESSETFWLLGQLEEQ